MKPVVAIDGPAGSGKGTLARMIASHFSFIYLDTGVLYRTIAFANLSLEQLKSMSINELLDMRAKFSDDQLRSSGNGVRASNIAKIPEIREIMTRLQRDFIDIQPDIVSIMIGVNDVWHHYLPSHQIETTDEAFEHNYRTVLEAIKTQTNAKIYMIEPYLLSAEDKTSFRPEFSRKVEIVRALAREFADAYLPLDGLLAEACIFNPPTYFSPDGVHPNADGACFIGEKYLERISPLIEQLIEKDS